MECFVELSHFISVWPELVFFSSSFSFSFPLYTIDIQYYMDFTWVNDGHSPRKHPNLLQKPPNIPSPLSSVRY